MRPPWPCGWGMFAVPFVSADPGETWGKDTVFKLPVALKLNRNYKIQLHILKILMRETQKYFFQNNTYLNFFNTLWFIKKEDNVLF